MREYKSDHAAPLFAYLNGKVLYEDILLRLTPKSKLVVMHPAVSRAIIAYYNSSGEDLDLLRSTPGEICSIGDVEVELRADAALANWFGGPAFEIKESEI